MDAMLYGLRNNFIGRLSDTAIDNRHAAIGGSDRDLLRPIRMAVEPRFADEKFRGRSKLASKCCNRFADLVGRSFRLATHNKSQPGRRPVFAEDPPQALAPFAGRSARLGAGGRRLPDIA